MAIFQGNGVVITTHFGRFNWTVQCSKCGSIGPHNLDQIGSNQEAKYHLKEQHNHERER